MKLSSALRLPVLFLTLLAAVMPSSVPAAVAPAEVERLDAWAGVIVTGKVAEITATRNKEGTVEIKLEVTSVIKGKVKAGETLRILTYSSRYKTNNENIVGGQGLDPLPAKGDTVKAWLNPAAGSTPGNTTYSTPIPNGVQVVPGSPAAGKK
jgi:hypothetical protein